MPAAPLTADAPAQNGHPQTRDPCRQVAVYSVPIRPRVERPPAVAPSSRSGRRRAAQAPAPRRPILRSCASRFRDKAAVTMRRSTELPFATAGLPSSRAAGSARPETPRRMRRAVTRAASSRVAATVRAPSATQRAGPFNSKAAFIHGRAFLAGRRPRETKTVLARPIRRLDAI